MIHLSTIRILFRAPDSLALYGIPYEMRKDVGQEPRHLWKAAERRAIAHYPSMMPTGKSPIADWVYIPERENDSRAWLSALEDVPENPYEWCECKLASDATLNTVRRHDELATITHELGDVVRVLPAYRQPMGSEPARFVADGTEGLYIVQGQTSDHVDYKLVGISGRGDGVIARLLSDEPGSVAIREAIAAESHWAITCNPSRMVRYFRSAP